MQQMSLGSYERNANTVLLVHGTDSTDARFAENRENQGGYVHQDCNAKIEKALLEAHMYGTGYFKIGASPKGKP